MAAGVMLQAVSECQPVLLGLVFENNFSKTTYRKVDEQLLCDC